MYGLSSSRPLPPFLLPDPDDDVLPLQEPDGPQQQQQPWQQQCLLVARAEEGKSYQVR
jgi:hypothetical protein